MTESGQSRWNSSIALGAILIFGSLALAGCTSQRPDGTVRRHYFPYAVVTTPPVALLSANVSLAPS